MDACFGRAKSRASRIWFLGLCFHTVFPEASQSSATDPSWQISCTLILILLLFIIIANRPISIRSAWCLKPLLISACHWSLRCMCLPVTLREEWYYFLETVAGWGGSLRPSNASAWVSVWHSQNMTNRTLPHRMTHSFIQHLLTIYMWQALLRDLEGESTALNKHSNYCHGARV